MTWPAEEMHEIIEAARGTTWEIPVLVAATTGARRGETLAIRWRHVDLDAGTVSITEAIQRVGGATVFQAPKTDRARRVVPIPAFAVERLRAHKADQARRRLALGAGWVDVDLVCERGDGLPFDPDAFTHGFQRIAVGVGLEGVRLHDLRHAVATRLAASGLPPSETSRILGHASAAFTMSVYTHSDQASAERARRAIETVFEGR